MGYATDQSVGLFEISVGAVIILMLSFYLLFGSGSVFFDIVFANAIDGDGAGWSVDYPRDAARSKP